MLGTFNPFNVPKQGDSGFDHRFLKAVSEEVQRVGKIVFSSAFSTKSLGNGGLFVDVAGGSAAIVFSGTAYIAGRKITGLSSDSAKPWVRCFLDTATAEEHAGPPPDPFPSNEEWYEKAQTAGNIHIPRA